MPNAAPTTQLQDPYSLVHAHYWPNLDPQLVQRAAQVYGNWGQALDDAADSSYTTYRPWFADILQGNSGNALLASHDTNVSAWLADANTYNSLAAAAKQAATDLSELRTTLAQIINDWQPWWEWGELLRLFDPTVGEQLMEDASNGANSAAAAATSAAVTSISSTLAAVSTKLPAEFDAADDVGANNGGGNIVTVGFETGGNGSQGVTSASGTPVVSTGNPSTGAPSTSGSSGSGSSSSGSGGSNSGGNGANPGSGPANSGGANPPATSTTGSDGSAPASGSSGQPDPGSAQAPPTQSSPGGSSAPTSDGSGGSQPVSTAPVTSSGTPMSSAPASSSAPPPASSGNSRSGQGQGQGQNSGSSSGGDGTGLATSGVVPSTMQPVPVFGGQGHPGAGALAPIHGMADGAPHSMDGLGSSGGGGVGGGGMMPMSPSPGPLAPYSPPGAAVSAPTPSAPTSAAPLAPASAGAAAGGAGALIAGGVGARKGATPTKKVNLDMESAQRVLAGLVKACPTRPIFWAVSVLRTSVGPQTLIAGSVGGGAYLPAEVSVPSTVQLAVLDPSLPSDWAAEWMGWQSPLAILVDHYELVTKVVAGVTVSAMATSELWPSPPECGGDFSAVRHEELVTSAAAPLVGGHRLTATDPALAARLAALDRGGDITSFVAAQLTRAVWIAGSQPDDTGMPIAVKEDADLLGLVAQGAATREHWENYHREVERRAEGAVMMPEIHAPRDADDSPGSATARMWYRHYYARGRIAEMVTCWESHPVSLLDLAYCGVAAGFGAVIAAVVTELEKQLQRPPGPTGGTP